MSDSIFDLTFWMARFGYSAEWTEFGFIDVAFVQEQARTFELGSDHELEHYKWAGYRRLLATTDFSAKSRWREFVQLIEADPNEHLFRGAVGELLDMNRIPPDWLTEYEGSGARFLTIPSIRRKLDCALNRRTAGGP